MAKNLPNFISRNLKLHDQYCHITYKIICSHQSCMISENVLIILCTCSVTGPQFTVQVHLIKRGVESSFQLWKLFQEQDNSKVWVKLKWFLALLMVSRKIKGGNQKRAAVAAAEIFQILVRINEFQKYIIECCRIWFIIVWKGQWIKKPVGLFACRFFHFSTVFNETFSIKRPSSQ